VSFRQELDHLKVSSRIAFIVDTARRLHIFQRLANMRRLDILVRFLRLKFLKQDQVNLFFLHDRPIQINPVDQPIQLVLVIDSGLLRSLVSLKHFNNTVGFYDFSFADLMQWSSYFRLRDQINFLLLIFADFSFLQNFFHSLNL